MFVYKLIAQRTTLALFGPQYVMIQLKDVHILLVMTR